jgi:hypothetical protein
MAGRIKALRLMHRREGSATVKCGLLNDYSKSKALSLQDSKRQAPTHSSFARLSKSDDPIAVIRGPGPLFSFVDSG